MKVKITKTIDIHQIPNEARRMIDSAKNNLVYGLPESMNQIIPRLLSSQGDMFFQSIDYIDSFRQQLASLDESMQEIENIVTGYKKAMMPEEDHDEEWLAKEEAETEKREAQYMDADEVEDEEG